MLSRNFTTKIKAARKAKVAIKLAQKEVKEPEKVFSGRRDDFEALPYTSESAEVINHLSKVVLIRHGNSMFNQLFHKLEGEGYIVTPRYFDEYSDLDIIDSSLSPTGIEQCEVSSTLANQVWFEYIFVSPLRRAMQTAYYMFRNHPNFDRIQFIVHPQARENIMTVADIPGEITEIVDEFSSKFPNLCTRYISRDFSGKLDNLHYARDLTPQLTEKIDGCSKEEVDLILADEIKHTFPKSIERFQYTNGRVQGFKEFVRQFIINEALTPQGKIGIVGHSYFFKLWTGLWYDRNLIYRKQPKEYVWMNNCELFPDYHNFPLHQRSSQVWNELPVDNKI